MLKKKNDRVARKLTLTRETIRRLDEKLTDRQLKEAVGGKSATCGDDGASVSTAPC